MIIWKKGSVDSNVDWILIDEDNDKELIASIIISENSDGTCNADAVCRKIGYMCQFDHLEKWKLKTILTDVKKFVVIELFHLRAENQKPVDKKIYKMIDNIPVWVHLKNGAQNTKINLKANDYGKFAEFLGNRILHNITQRGGILDNMFHEVEIIRVDFIKNFKILEKEKIGLGDVVVEVDYRKDDVFGKKIVIFEIKHGKIMIDQNQLRRYCSMIINPREHFHKADEIRVIYMIFDDLDTMNACAYYSVNEMDKDFARNILEREPIESYCHNTEEQKPSNIDAPQVFGIESLSHNF